MNTGIDGGMNKVFAAKLPDGNTGLSEGGDGQGLSLLALSRAPGTIPSHVNPPKPKLTPEEEPVVAVSSSASQTRVATATPAQQPAQSDGWFSSLARKVGIGGSETTASAPPPADGKPKAESKPAPASSCVRLRCAEAGRAEAGRAKQAQRPRPGAKAVGLRRTGASRCPRPGRNDRRRSAGRAGELVREPFWGGEVRRVAASPIIIN